MENIEEQRDILGLPPYVFPAAMLVFGYPTEQQVLRKKPERADMKYIVHENSYHALSAEELKDMLSYHSLSELKADYPRFARMHHKSSILS